VRELFSDTFVEKDGSTLERRLAGGLYPHYELPAFYAEAA